MNLTNSSFQLVKRPLNIQSLIDLHNLPQLSPRTSNLYISEADKFSFHAVSSSEVQKVVMSFPSDNINPQVALIIQMLQRPDK